MKNSDQKLLKKIERAKFKKIRIEQKGKRTNEPNLKELSDALDSYYFINKMKVYCTYLSYSKIVNPETINYTHTDLRLIPEIIAFVESDMDLFPLLKIYNHIRKLFEHIEQPFSAYKTIYNSLLGLINSYKSIFAPEETAEIYSYITNFCLRKMNGGDIEFRSRFFLASNEMLNATFSKKGKKRTPIPGSVLKNMVVIGLRLNDKELFGRLISYGLKKEQGFKDTFEWTELFIEFYQSKLSIQDKNTYLPYCLAYLEFEKRNFSKAYLILQNPIRVHGMFINMHTKILHLQIIFEINNEDPAILEKDGIEIEKVIEAYRGLIRDETNRKKRFTYQSDYYITFGKMYKEIYNFFKKYSGILYNEKNEKFQNEKSRIQANLSNINYYYKIWLSKKLIEIK